MRALAWSDDDTHLISAGADGAVYDWHLQDQRRERESVLKGCSYTSVVTAADGLALFVAGSDRKLKELEAWTQTTT